MDLSCVFYFMVENCIIYSIPVHQFLEFLLSTGKFPYEYTQLFHLPSKRLLQVPQPSEARWVTTQLKSSCLLHWNFWTPSPERFTGWRLPLFNDLMISTLGTLSWVEWPHRYKYTRFLSKLNSRSFLFPAPNTQKHSVSEYDSCI